MPPAPPTDDSPCRNPADACVRVAGLVDLAHALARLEPPPAYRLSLDSGVEYKNVRRTLAQPLAARLDTWHRLLRSLHIRPIAVARVPDGTGSGSCSGGVTRRAGECDCQRAAAVNAAALRGLREVRGWSRREMARRAGVGVDAIGSLENGRGMVGSLLRVYAALGLELVLALPPGQASLADLWRERAGRCLDAPAQFPIRAPRRRAARAVPHAGLLPTGEISPTAAGGFFPATEACPPHSPPLSPVGQGEISAPLRVAYGVG